MIELSELKPILPLMIPIVAIVMGVGIGMMALWLDHQKKTQILDLHHRERLHAMERGIDPPALPVGLLESGPRRLVLTPSDHLRRGLIWLLGGSAVVAALWASSGSASSAVWGMVPLAVGVAYLIWYAADARRPPPA